MAMSWRPWPWFGQLYCLWFVSPNVKALPNFQLQRVAVEYDTQMTINHDRSLQQQDTTRYEPIRIEFDTRVLDGLYGQANTDVDRNIEFIKTSILPQAAQIWARHLYVRPILSNITPIIIDQNACAGLYASFLTSAVPYSNADIVVVVGGDPGQIRDGGSGTLTDAIPCSLDTTYDRPITGTFNFHLSDQTTWAMQVSSGASPLGGLGNGDIPLYYSLYTNNTFHPEKLGTSLLDQTVHELAHILGFNTLLYPLTRDENGIPRTPRDNSTDVPIGMVPPRSATYRPQMLYKSYNQPR
jgi:Leishmanolysin